MEKIKNEIIIIDEETIKKKVYLIRGQQVMLDFELAEIYGYTTKAFNQQVKNNKDKFDGYIFQLTKAELDNLVRSKFLTSRIWIIGNTGGRTSLPYAFTEPGIYMLMTVMRGPLATEQSRKLISIFQGMKNYIVQSNHLLSMNAVIELTNQVNKNKQDIHELKDQFTVIADNFIDPNKYEEFLILEGEKFKADVAYKTIFSLAKRSIVIVDNYISYKTLDLLRGVDPKIDVVIMCGGSATDLPVQVPEGAQSV